VAGLDWQTEGCAPVGCERRRVEPEDLPAKGAPGEIQCEAEAASDLEKPGASRPMEVG